MRRKAVVAMSGGVDSSVAAALMKEEGFEVIGIMLKLWRGEAANNESGCCSLDAAEDARRVAQVLDIPFYVFNFAEYFERTVVDSFINSYARGTTPNPCVECNRSVKFSALLERARAYEAAVLATGHYARVQNEGERFRLLRGKDLQKDQSYVLYMLDQAELRMSLFPVGHYEKTEIRSIAASLGLRTATKAESQEICFVPNGNSHAFLGERVPEGSRPGPIMLTNGKQIGTHRGYAHYTVGQRRGLGVSVGVPLFVREIRHDDNAVIVDEEPAEVKTLLLDDVSFVSGESVEGRRVAVMTRYRGPEAEATLERGGKGLIVEFDRPQPAAAPGQAAVFYEDDDVLGGGTIVATR